MLRSGTEAPGNSTGTGPINFCRGFFPNKRDLVLPLLHFLRVAGDPAVIPDAQRFERQTLLDQTVVLGAVQAADPAQFVRIMG